MSREATAIPFALAFALGTLWGLVASWLGDALVDEPEVTGPPPYESLTCDAYTLTRIGDRISIEFTED